jgi:hypothetical protein
MSFSGVMPTPGRELAGGGLAAQVLQHLPPHPGQPANDLDHGRRKADRAGLLGHRPGDRLPDPPGGIGGELVAPGVVELLHAADQPDVALLDQVQDQHAVAGIPPGQRDDQARVGLEQVVLGPPAVFGDPLKIDALAGAQHSAAVGELLLGEQPGLDPLGKLDLLPGCEQRHPADLLQAVLDQVGGRAGGCHPGGGKALVVLAGNPRLVLALLARRRRRTAGRSRDVALAGARLPLTGRLLAARTSSRASPERAMSTGLAGSGPPISAASPSPTGSAGSVNPTAAPRPPPAATASCG